MNSSIRTLRNVVVGALVAAAVGLVPGAAPVATFVGGAVAGYLQAARARGGALVGLAVGLVPVGVALLVLAGAATWALASGVPAFGWLDAAGGGAFVVLLFVAVGLGSAVLGALGGAAGGLVADRRGADGTVQTDRPA